MAGTRAPISDTLAQRLAEQTLAARLSDFRPEVVDKAKLCLIDFLACALEAGDLPWSRQALQAVSRVERGAALIGRGAYATPADAAFVNAVTGHGLVREDMHVGAVAHLGVVVWPALLASASQRRVDGAQFLTAAIVGYETGARLGRALITTDLARLFRPTGLVGAPAAALALSAQARSSPDVARNAVALAANTVAGLNQWPHSGGSEMYFHPGFAARNGLSAFDLALAGAEASPAIFEGEAGLFAAYARKRFDGTLDLFANGEAEILTVFNKEVPACNFAQTPCQAALRALDRIGSSRDIARVELRVTEAAERYPGCNGKGPFANALQAKMSIYYGVAATLARREVAEANYARLDDPEIARLIGASTMIVDPSLTAAYPARQGAAIRLTRRDGSAVEAALDDVEPATPALIRARFDAQAALVWNADTAEKITEIIAGLEDAPDIGRLATLCGLRDRRADARPNDQANQRTGFKA